MVALVPGLLEDAGHSRARAYGPRYAGHPDPRVRSRVPGLFDRPLDPETARAVRDLGRRAVVVVDRWGVGGGRVPGGVVRCEFADREVPAGRPRARA